MTADFFRARWDQMIGLRHPLAALAQRLPWSSLEAALLRCFAHKARAAQTLQSEDLFGPTLALAGGGVSPAGRPRLPIRLMASLLYLRHANNLSDEQVVQRCSDEVFWQYLSGQVYYRPSCPCNTRLLGRFRVALGEAGVEGLLEATIDTALQTKAITLVQLEQTTILLEDTGRRPEQAIGDLGYRGVDAHNPGVEILHRGKLKSLTARQRRWLKRRQAIEPAIGHLKSDHPLVRCWLRGALGDALHAVLCAAGYNLCWLMRAMPRLGLKGDFLRLSLLTVQGLLQRAVERLDPHASGVACVGGVPGVIRGAG
jgi:hypothetical protein